MSKRLSYERYLWFHQRLKKKTFPKLKDLMEEFEISQRQAAREIEHMRLFFYAPIEYSADKKGYYYEDDSFEFPVPMVSEEEIISLVIAKRLSVTIPDERRKRQLNFFFENLSAYFDLDIAELEKKISLKNVRYSRVLPEVFDTVLQALNKNKKLSITYRSVFTKEYSQRIINPLHLVLYMGNWHIMAFCEMRKGIRDFALSRIQKIEILAENIAENLKSIDIKKEIDGVHGIFFEGKREKVVLRFNEGIADYVREQVWFPGQTLVEEENGEVTLSFFVTDFREVVREVLSFGAEVEVVQPEALREIIKENIKKLARMY
ncbi:MAG: WYL domain-containing protein [Candidatus Aminicenantes bacterium]|nr:MAG: WYL domain-containing protein [Candidatus Aminicenantes bacterium]